LADTDFELDRKPALLIPLLILGETA